MSTIKKLLEGIDIEWKSLGEVFEIKTGKGVTKKDSTESGDYPIISGGKEPMGYINTFNRNENTVTISRVGANAGFVSFITKKFYLNDKCFSVLQNDTFKNKIISKYMYYFLKSKEQNIIDLQSDGGVPTINTTKVSNIIIPIPPLHIQSEIVRILDSFTELTTELTTELHARKKQYEYYRDKLLSFEDWEVEWKSLGEVADVGVGSKPEIIHETVQNFEYINAGTTNSGYTDNFNCDGNTVTTPSRGQGGIGFVGYQKNDFWLGPLCYRIKSKKDSNVITKYLYFFLEHNNQLILGLKKEGGVPAVNRGDLIKLNIPIPPLAQQEKIVSILDKFDTLTNSISEGLPREITLRQQQYEYYRNLLLSFSKKD